MKQLLILSGKGGTGKTTIASAFIKLSNAEAFADCDVDAPNLHLISLQSSEPNKEDFFGMPKAQIDTELCTKCGLCMRHCRFNAIISDPKYEVNLFACEGCGVCEAICPTGAISLNPAVSGELMLYKDGERIFSTAQLKMGSGNSGMLVTEVKKQMKAETLNTNLAIIDGSPGIGCPVIASLSGVDMVLIVAEPSLSGISDMERIIKTSETFGNKIAVCVNKFDTNKVKTEQIEAYCKSNGIPSVGRIPFDSAAVKAVNSGRTIVDTETASGHAVKDVFNRSIQLLFEKCGGH